MAQGNGQGISGIFLGALLQPKQVFHHLCDLHFLGTALAHHRLFDLPGRVFEHRQ